MPRTASAAGLNVRCLAAILILSSGLATPKTGGSRVERVVVRAYGLCAIIFGFNHFFSLAQTAGMVPRWLPPSPMFWPIATGVFYCVGGVSILSNIQALTAARLIACMMMVIEALVWIPYLLGSPKAHMAWAGNGTDVALAGAALVVSDKIARSGSDAARKLAFPKRKRPV